jgi:dienelactone hydrolase
VLDAPDPGQPGPHGVLTLYYGSGTDDNRPEYRDSVSIVTPTVDASTLVDLGSSAEERNDYWGFTPEEMPLNARVWYPDGEGPFPLVLVVHGNHDPSDFSDPGYDYLGELLASRGYILASVDENFINGGIREENDARGWFLLKHLELFRGWNEEAGNPFRGKVDLENIVLMGHSRGGEAVANAAAFNRLDRYPDDATMEFDFDFDIRGIVSIAPVDGQYLPTGRKVPVEDVSYLVFHGSHDGDVTSFHGLRIYDRLTFTDSAEAAAEAEGRPLFKSAIYVYRANHGQWNTVWQNKDNGPRSGRILDLRTLMPGEDQRRFAELYVSAFLDAVLKKDTRYLPMFRDHRVVGGWLPPTMYITRYETAGFRPLATFEEDIDVTTGTWPGVRLRGDSLAVWKEDMLQLRSSNRSSTSASQENQAVWLGWNNRIEGADTTRHGPPAVFAVELPAGLAADQALDEGTTLDLMLAVTEDTPAPRKDPEAGREEEDEEEAADAPPRRDGGEDEEEPPVDLTVEVEDAAGRTARVALSDYGPVRRPLETWISMRRDRERERFATHWELVLQSYSIPLGDFTAEEPALELARLAEVRLVFDRVAAGEVVVDQIGLSDLHPDFLRDRVER